MRLTAVRTDGSYQAVVDSHDGDISQILEQAMFQARVSSRTVHFTHNRMPFAITANTTLCHLRAEYEKHMKKPENAPPPVIISLFPKWKVAPDEMAMAG